MTSSSRSWQKHKPPAPGAARPRAWFAWARIASTASAVASYATIPNAQGPNGISVDGSYAPAGVDEVAGPWRDHMEIWTSLDSTRSCLGPRTHPRGAGSLNVRMISTASRICRRRESKKGSGNSSEFSMPQFASALSHPGYEPQGSPGSKTHRIRSNPHASSLDSLTLRRRIESIAMALFSGRTFKANRRALRYLQPRFFLSRQEPSGSSSCHSIKEKRLSGSIPPHHVEDMPMPCGLVRAQSPATKSQEPPHPVAMPSYAMLCLAYSVAYSVA